MPAFVRSRRLWAAAALAVLGLAFAHVLGQEQTAEAHPLGNFTINHYSRIELSPETIAVRYVLDMAEIPTFQEREGMDSDGDGALSPAERMSYLDARVEQIRAGLYLAIAGDQRDLRASGSEMTFPAGQGGLDTMRIVIDFAAPMVDGWQDSNSRAEYRDENYGERVGWREIVVRSFDGVRIVDSTAPSQDVSNELRSYPTESISNPLDVGAVSFDFEPGPGTETGPSPVMQAAPVTSDVPGRTQGRFTALIAKEELSLAFILGALAVAFGFGALHALGPGHGKTIVAAYLVGERGTARHALLLGLTVTATHTSSVFALGFGTLYASQFIVPERLYSYLSLFSGLLVVGLGVLLLIARARSLRARKSAPDGAHGHAHPHVHASHDAENPFTWKSLIPLGISGGMLPCPSALVVLLGAISLHRVGLGLVLVVAFSVGLATVLTGIGLGLVLAGRLLASARSRFAGSFVERWGLAQRATMALPALSALAITLVGTVMTFRALMGPTGFGI